MIPNRDPTSEVSHMLYVITTVEAACTRAEYHPIYRIWLYRNGVDMGTGYL